MKSIKRTLLRPVLGFCFLVLLLGLGLGPETARAQTTGDAATENTDGEGGDQTGASGLDVPRFVSLRAPEVNLRTGPGTRYPIEWVYRRRNLPVEVIDEFDTWRRIRDPEGTEGWVHQSMLQGRRFVMVLEDWAVVRRDPQDGARGLVRLEPGAIAQLDGCGELWCVVEIESHKGWVKRELLYGIYPDEEMR